MDVVSHRIHFVKCWLSSIKTLTEPFYFHKLSHCIYRTILCSLYGVDGDLQSQQVGLVGYSQQEPVHLWLVTSVWVRMRKSRWVSEQVYVEVNDLVGESGWVSR